MDWNALGVVVNIVLSVAVLWLAYRSHKTTEAIARLDVQQALMNAPAPRITEITPMGELGEFMIDVVNVGRDPTVILETRWEPGAKTGFWTARHRTKTVETFPGEDEGPLTVPGRGHIRYFASFPSLMHRMERDPDEKTFTLRGILSIRDAQRIHDAWKLTIDIDQEDNITGLFIEPAREPATGASA